MRNKKYIRYSSRVFAFVMSAVLASGMPVSAQAAAKKEKQKREDKMETVYVNADAEGEAEQVTVSEWLRNPDGSETLEDYSNLKEITNVKGDETFTEDSSGNLTWDARGNDIYYQGKTEEALPVSMEVSYYLDGQKISPEELAGKSGKVKIRFDYYNHSSEKVKVKGEDYEIQTPFTMVTAMVLPSDIFTNVQVENGQVMADGDKNIVVGIAFPGLGDSLKLSDYDALSEVTLPDYVEVTADVNDFALSMTLTAAATGILDEMDIGSIGGMDDLEENIKKLTDASEALENGSGELLEGLNTLSDSFDTYTDGVTDADQGAQELKKGLETLDSRKKDLTDGADDLKDGLKTLKDGTQSLKDGIKKYTGGVSGLDAGLQTADSGAQSLKKGAGTLQKGLKNYTDGVASLQEGLAALQKQLDTLENVSLPDSGTLSAVKTAAGKLEEDAAMLQKNAAAVTSAMEQINQLSSLTEKHNADVKERFSEAEKALDKVDEKASGQANEQMEDQKDSMNSRASSQAVRQAKAAVDAQDIPEEEKAALKKAIEEAIDIQVDVDSITIKGAADEAREALGTAPTLDISSVDLNLSDMESLLSDMKDQAAVLETFAKSTSELADLTKNLPALTDGVSELKEGADALTGKNETMLTGMKTLRDGLDALSSGITTMQTGAALLSENNDTLNDGADAAEKGAGKLHSGSRKLKKGITDYTAGVATAAGGAGTLSDGTARLRGAGSLLTDGIDKLLAGAGTLSSGMEEFNKDGIGKISDLAGDDLQAVIHRFKAIKKADKKYDSFAGKQKEASGSVRFIIETGAVETDDGE